MIHERIMIGYRTFDIHVWSIFMNVMNGMATIRMVLYVGMCEAVSGVLFLFMFSHDILLLQVSRCVVVVMNYWLLAFGVRISSDSAFTLISARLDCSRVLTVICGVAGVRLDFTFALRVSISGKYAITLSV
jgi:hypothetical protein